MGGAQDRVEIYLIAHPDDDQAEARGLLMEEFATFDAGKARCFLPSDREHLLAVIEAGFGDFDTFPRRAQPSRKPSSPHDVNSAAPPLPNLIARPDAGAQHVGLRVRARLVPRGVCNHRIGCKLFCMGLRRGHEAAGVNRASVYGY